MKNNHIGFKGCGRGKIVSALIKSLCGRSVSQSKDLNEWGSRQRSLLPKLRLRADDDMGWAIHPFYVEGRWVVDGFGSSEHL